MGEKRTSSRGPIGSRPGDPDASVETGPASGKTSAKQRKPGGMEEIAAAVALAIDRGRRATRPPVPAFEVRGTAGPGEWARSGRIAQVNRSPARDPWNQ